MSIKRAFIPFALAATTALTACGRITENEVAVITKRGAIEEVVTEPQLYCMPACLPWTDIIRYKTFNDTFTISSGSGANTGANQNNETSQSRQIFLRSQDDKFIESVSFSISYEIVKTPNASKLYTEFRAVESSGDENSLLIRDDLQILATQPLVNVIRTQDALSIQDNGDLIGRELATQLQKAVNERLEIKDGEISPINIKAINLGGVKFDPETEALLKQKIFAREQVAIAQEANKAAEVQAQAALAQAGVTSGIADKFKQGGAPADQVANLVCLDLHRQKLLPSNIQCFGAFPAQELTAK